MEDGEVGVQRHLRAVGKTAVLKECIENKAWLKYMFHLWMFKSQLLISGRTVETRSSVLQGTRVRKGAHRAPSRAAAFRACPLLLHLPSRLQLTSSSSDKGARELCHRGRAQACLGS